MIAKRKQPPPKPRKPKRKQQPRRPIRRIPKAVVSKVCGLTDPFCIHANGAKYPDDSATRTLAYTYKGRRVLTTDGAGTAAYLWYPQYAFHPTTYAATRVGPNVTAWTAFPVLTPMIDVASYRIVSSGFTLKSIVAPLNASGEVNLRTFGADPAQLTAVDLQTYNATSSTDVPLRLVNSLSCISQHTAQMPQNFYTVPSDSSDVATVRPNGYAPTTIYISGAPANTGCIVMEFVIHFELIFNEDSGLAQACTPPPPANSIITMAANKVTSTLPSFFQKSVDMVGDFLARKATAALGGMLGGPAGAAISGGGYALLVD